MGTVRLWVALLVLSLLLGAAAAHAGQLPAKKKLLEYGWDVPTPEFVCKNTRAMERKPFDGVIMRLAGAKQGNIFMGGKWQEADLAADYKYLRQIRWSKFTDNFIMMYSASEMDWFSDEDWAGVLSNVRLMARAARLGRCHLAFDAEPYGKNPWAYTEQKQAGQRSWPEYRDKAFQRGQQFIRVIESELPRNVLVTLFTYSLFREMMDQPDPVRRDEALRGHSYALYLPFVNGMLSAMGPGMTLTDGNEPSYYYPDSESFLSVYHAMKQGALNLVPPNLTTKFQLQNQASQALYMDYVFARVPWKNIPALWMTPEEQALWFQHNVYWALRTSDEYVWLYSEKMNWWTDKDIPAGMEEAIVKAREAIAAGRPLGFKMTDIMRRVEEKKTAEIAAKLLRAKAEVTSTSQKPTLDGDLSDPVWATAAKLGPFVPTFGNQPEDLKAATTARAAWDAEYLYLAVDCAEPAVKDMQFTGLVRDDSVWMGDSLDIFLGPANALTPYYHLILSPKNVQWDALYATDNDMSWNPTWRSATQIGEKSWRAEIAIPWAELKLQPQAGMVLKANLCRQRRPGNGELSSWSQVLRGFMEPEHFGTLTLR